MVLFTISTVFFCILKPGAFLHYTTKTFCVSFFEIPTVIDVDSLVTPPYVFSVGSCDSGACKGVWSDLGGSPPHPISSPHSLRDAALEHFLSTYLSRIWKASEGVGWGWCVCGGELLTPMPSHSCAGTRTIASNSFFFPLASIWQISVLPTWGQLYVRVWRKGEYWFPLQFSLSFSLSLINKKSEKDQLDPVHPLMLPRRCFSAVGHKQIFYSDSTWHWMFCCVPHCLLYVHPCSKSDRALLQFQTKIKF